MPFDILLTILGKFPNHLVIPEDDPLQPSDEGLTSTLINLVLVVDDAGDHVGALCASILTRLTPRLLELLNAASIRQLQKPLLLRNAFPIVPKRVVASIADVVNCISLKWK